MCDPFARATGYKVVHLNFENGEPTGAEHFPAGFPSEDGETEFARVADLVLSE